LELRPKKRYPCPVSNSLSGDFSIRGADGFENQYIAAMPPYLLSKSLAGQKMREPAKFNEIFPIS
jgi:hypothetical protein